MPISSVQQAHDALLALKPAGALHEGCPVCGPEMAAEQEVAHVAETTALAPAGNVYTEAQHFSLLESAVERETAAMTAEKSELEARVTALESEKAATATELSEARARIDVLEADKVNAEAAAEAVRTELADFKAEIERKARVEELKASRKARVQTANANLGDAYYSDERVTRWAEMSDEQFDLLAADMADAAKDAPASKDDDAKADADKAPDKTAEKARETAAFTGGETPSASEGSILGQFLGARRGLIKS